MRVTKSDTRSSFFCPTNPSPFLSYTSFLSSPPRYPAMDLYGCNIFPNHIHHFSLLLLMRVSAVHACFVRCVRGVCDACVYANAMRGVRCVLGVRCVRGVLRCVRGAH